MNMSPTNSPALVIDFEHDDHEKQEHLMLHITNLLKDFGNIPLQVEVVCYGPGIMLLVSSKTDFSQQITQLQQQGVQFRACRNAMNMFEVEEKDLIQGVTIVPSGVGRIVKAQLDGYVYFKG